MLAVKQDCMVHIELISDQAVGGALCLAHELPDGQWSLPVILEVGPFDTALDVAVWITKQMVALGLVSR